MSVESVVDKMVVQVMKRKQYSSITEGIVTSVDKEAKTCEIKRDDLPELFDVRLNAIIGATGTFTIYPAVNSNVLVGIIDGILTDAVVLSCDAIDDIIFNDGTNGGLVIVGEVVSQIQEVKNDLNNLKTIFKNWTVAPNDGGAALKAAAATWFATELADVDSEAMQNVKFKH